MRYVRNMDRNLIEYIKMEGENYSLKITQDKV